MTPRLKVSKEVAEALNSKLPVVALESTIVSHGMPYPQNLNTALEVESIIRSEGAIPATIALIDGNCCIGLSKNELERLANDSNVVKVSLRDIPFVLANNSIGSTTVAATARIAQWANIQFFVTGGIGGVHRGANISFDVSADLYEMAKSNVTIVSAGVKSILDIDATLEYLETMGVPVITYGQTEFPAFYSRLSGCKSPMSTNDLNVIANTVRIKRELNIEGAVLVANPIPLEMEIPYDIIESSINNALLMAEKQEVKGKNTTPFLLKSIAHLTQGKSLEVNIALIKNNALLGAQLAKTYANIH